MEAVPTEIEGVLTLRPKVFTDPRGSFVKTYHAGMFRELGLDFRPVEEFYSVSARDVVRGMHFQLPPADHAKCVFCLTGAVLDVVLDLRRASPTFGRVSVQELSAGNREMLFIPTGCAHGFLSLAENTTMFYQTSAVHSPARDAGVHWDSFGWRWPVARPIVSARDAALPRWGDFDSPF